MSHKKHLLLLALLAIIFLPSLFFSKNTPIPASAASGIPLSGYAWSSNIGWINFNGNGGTVTIDSTSGNLSGYAWNADDSGISGGAKSGIGWIKLGPPTGVSRVAVGAPVTPGNDSNWAHLEGNNLKGWARACVVYVDSAKCEGAEKNINSTELGGWDGWISLAGIATNGSVYGVTSKKDDATGVRTFYGYAWGGGSSPTTESSPQSIGWISFNYEDKAAPTVPTIPAGCTTNCGFVTVLETVAPPAPISATCLVDGVPEPATVSITPGASVNLSLGLGSGYSVQWYQNLSIPVGPSLTNSPYSYQFNSPLDASIGGQYIFSAKVTSGSASQTVYCPSNGVNIIAPTTLGFANVDDATVKFVSTSATPACKAGSSPCAYPGAGITISYPAGATSNKIYDLSVDSVLKGSQSGTAIPGVYWNKDNPTKGPLFIPSSIDMSNPQLSKLTINFTRQPAGQPKIENGIYYIKILATPRDGGEVLIGYMKVTISSSGGTYIEQ